MHGLHRAVLTVYVVLLLSWNANGQHIQHLHHNERSQLGIEYLTPLFERKLNISPFSSVWFFSGRFPIGGNVSAVADIPVAYMISSNRSFDAEAILGNPFIGIEVSRLSSWTYAELGIRIPVVSDQTMPESILRSITDASRFEALHTEINRSASLFGVVTDIDRFEAFSPEAIPITLKFGYRNVSSSNIYSNLLAGFVGIFTTDSRSENELYVDYGGVIGYDLPALRLTAGLSGRWLVSQPGLELNDHVVHHVTLAANTVMSTFRPGILVRMPIGEDFDQVIAIVVGLTLAVDL